MSVASQATSLAIHRKMMRRMRRGACSTPVISVISSCRESWSASEEGVAVHLECPGLRYSGGTAEGVDGVADLHVDEAGVFEHLLPARTGQPSSNSAGP